MKNLFKSLMLVAVAAMALSACTEENNEVAAVAKKTIIEMTASLNADSRSGFMEKEDGSTTYKSEWHEGDKILVVDNGNTDNYAIVDISKDGKFRAELEGDVTFIDVYSPAEAWERKVGYVEATIPAVQSPTDYSVDPKAHILKSLPTKVSEGNVMMGHAFAYGKMTVVAPEGFVIDHVDVAFKGMHYDHDYKHNLTLNATNVTDNVFMFSTYPMQVTEFTVTAYDTNGTTCTKSVDLIESETYFAFKYDTVVPFGVTLEANNDEPEEHDNVMDSASYYDNYNNLGVWDNWGYLVFEDEYLGTAIINLYTANENYIALGTHRSWTSNYVLYRIDGKNSFYKNKLLSPDVDNTMIVDVVDGKYNIQLSLTNEDEETLTATYVGDIKGIGYPEITEEPEEPEQPEQPGVKEFTIIDWFKSFGTWGVSSEFEIGWWDTNRYSIVIDFSVNPITDGTYTLDNGLVSRYCKFRSSKMTACTVVVNEVGNNDIRFDVTFEVTHNDEVINGHFVWIGDPSTL